MSDSAYDPSKIEQKIYKIWEESGAFKAGSDPKKTKQQDNFCVVMPPPNVTGSLHMGHALNNTLQDVLTRYMRMRGKNVLWQPGTDHAGIATQMVVERQLAERGEPGRKELGREKFLEKVWAWKETSGGTITSQLRRIGASCDWSRERFTMDEGLSKAVTKVFVQLYEEDLIYKDKRLVNWDPKLLTAISDLEVESRPVNGNMWHFKYPIDGLDGQFITVATTRPETMLGDTGVAVHPSDERYKDLVGKMVRLPLVDRLIPIVADNYPDPEQGSGAVKMTPAHDFNDFEVGRRQNLEMINIFDETAHLNDNVPEKYRGLERFAARKQIVKDLDDLGLLEKIDTHELMVPYGDRSGVVVEPRLTDQWYVKAEVLAKPAIEAVKSGKTKFVPSNWDKTYFEWMENIQPWCISRQLWWGHRIPVWYGPRVIEHGTHVTFDINDPIAICAVNFQEAGNKYAQYKGGRGGAAADMGIVEGYDEPGKPREAFIDGCQVLYRDPDVLDTWFSSALWPFSTLGWPDKTDELARYYPTHTLSTAFDIIFFWVARMMMMGLHFMKEVPFHTVYIHALVRDEHGKKMSKSKGNVVDPIGVIDQYGADALRFTMTAMAAQGRDVNMSMPRVEGYRNFANKLWNAVRFAEINGCTGDLPLAAKDVSLPLNRWIMAEMEQVMLKTGEAIESYRFNDAANLTYQFIWNVYCDWYVELSKVIFQDGSEEEKNETRIVTAWVIDRILLVLHPIMPFFTEELWGRLQEKGRKTTGLLINQVWPEAEVAIDQSSSEEISWAIEVISQIRSVRAEMNIPPKAQLKFALIKPNKQIEAFANRQKSFIQKLARLEAIDFAPEATKSSVQIISENTLGALELGGVVDVAGETARLNKALEKVSKEITGLDKKLANEKFLANAPEKVVEEIKRRYAEEQGKKEKIDQALKRLESLS